MSAPLRLAVVSTLPWPHVRRGNRCIYELGVEMARRGHDVTIIQPSPGRHRFETMRDGMRAVYIPLPDQPILTAFKIQRLATFGWLAAKELARSEYDIVQASYPVDAFAAARYARRTGTPYVYKLIDCNPFHPDFRFGKRMFEEGLAGASRVTALSAFVSGVLEREYGRPAIVVPPGCSLHLFTVSPPKDPKTARIVCTAAMGDPRKRVSVLVRGFEALLAKLPHAELILSGHGHERAQTELLAHLSESTRVRIRVLGLGRAEDLPEVYRNATISVLPSVNEAFGLVVTESLASGTPVVATRSGAIGEILDDPRVGVMFEENATPAEVADALVRGIELAGRPEAPGHCRDHVERRYAFSVLGDRYESIYREVLAEKARPALPPRPAWTPSAPTWQDFEASLNHFDLVQDDYFAALSARRGLQALGDAAAASLPTGGAAWVASPTKALPRWLEKRGIRVKPLPSILAEDSEATAPSHLLVVEVQKASGAAETSLVIGLRPGAVVALIPQADAAAWGTILRKIGYAETSSKRLFGRDPIVPSLGSTPVKTWLSRGLPRRLLGGATALGNDELIIWRRL